ncbi:Hypothetical predicted protein, partial [Paramuricea clavata]
ITDCLLNVISSNNNSYNTSHNHDNTTYNNSNGNTSRKYDNRQTDNQWSSKFLNIAVIETCYIGTLDCSCKFLIHNWHKASTFHDA